MQRPFEAYRMRKISEATARYERVLVRGFATADLDGQPEPETLQCRNELDRTNWIGLVLKAQAMIGAGFGAEPCEPPIRCTSNRMYAVTYADAMARMFDLLEKVGQAQANSWRLKDAVRDCPTREGLNDIDLDEGWP